jgi:transposase
MAAGRTALAGSRRSSREWAKLVRDWKRSGLSAVEFAAPRQISPRSLSWWRWHLTRSQPGRRGRETTPRLVRVDVGPEGAAPAALGWEIATERGRLVVHGQLDGQQLSAVLHALVGIALKP